ncbi:MAG: hypothetical protein JXA33_17185 [Anaerolineae bacterium]|nr:hypothetical protein [Anaerolineae bacterium]
MMITQYKQRWKSDTFEVQQYTGTHCYWVMLVTHREEKIPLSRQKLQELRDLLDEVLCEESASEECAVTAA